MDWEAKVLVMEGRMHEYLMILFTFVRPSCCFPSCTTFYLATNCFKSSDILILSNFILKNQSYHYNNTSSHLFYNMHSYCVNTCV